MKLTWVAARLNDSDLARLDELVERDCSSRSAVMKKALRAYIEASLFLPEPNQKRLGAGDPNTSIPPASAVKESLP